MKIHILFEMVLYGKTESDLLKSYIKLTVYAGIIVAFIDGLKTLEASK